MGITNEDLKIIGYYTLCNWGGYEVAVDPFEIFFYRWNNGEKVGEWEEMETEYNPDDDYKEWAYNPDQQAFLFPLNEVIKIS